MRLPIYLLAQNVNHNIGHLQAQLYQVGLSIMDLQKRLKSAPDKQKVLLKQILERETDRYYDFV